MNYYTMTEANYTYIVELSVAQEISVEKAWVIFRQIFVKRSDIGRSVCAHWSGRKR